MKTIPKRPLIPIVTDLLEYGKVGKHTIAYVDSMRAKYGDVCEVSFTGIKNYFIHDPEVIKEILTTHGGKMKRTYFFRAFRKLLGNGLFTSDGAYHRQQRRLIKPAFYPDKIQAYADVITSCAEEEINSWKAGSVININKAMTRITLKVITRSMFGASIDDLKIQEVGADLSAVFDIMNRVLQNPLYVYCLIHEINIPIVRKFFRYRKKLDGVVNGIITATRCCNENDKNDLLTLLINAKDEETGIGMTDEQIRDEVMTFFLAGHETTTLSLTWTLYLLAKDPHVQQQLTLEVERLLEGRLPEAKDYYNLAYTKNVFKESLRLYPPAWTFARETTEDVVIRDYRFPKGSVLWTVSYLMHRCEQYFHDADSFLPERWDEEITKSIPKYAFFPFGGGNRMCIGEGFAWMEGVLILATIAQRVQLSFPDNLIVKIDPVFTLRTSQDICMTVDHIKERIKNDVSIGKS